MTRVNEIKFNVYAESRNLQQNNGSKTEVLFDFSEEMSPIGEQLDLSKKVDKKTEEPKTNTDEKTEKFRKQLAPYGIRPHMVPMFDNAEEKEIEGKKYLVLTSEKNGYELSIPLDERFVNPSEIYALDEETGGEGGPTIGGVHGAILRQTSDSLPNKKDYPYYDDYKGVRIVNSEITFIGKYGSPDLINVDENSTVEFVTDDYADAVMAPSGFEELQPGTHKFSAKEEE